MHVMWNRWTSNPREHYTNADQTFPQPLCGQRLASDRATYADQPTGLAPLCPRCAKRAGTLT